MCCLYVLKGFMIERITLVYVCILLIQSYFQGQTCCVIRECVGKKTIVIHYLVFIG